MDIRLARAGDLPSLASLVEQLGYSSEGLEKRLSRYLGGPGMGVWVAESGGRIAGCLACLVLEQFHSARPLFHVVSLVVDRTFRGKGVGSLLLRFAEREAEKRGCEAIELVSALWRQREKTHDFYRKRGFLDSGECGKCYFRKNLT